MVFIWLDGMHHRAGTNSAPHPVFLAIGTLPLRAVVCAMHLEIFKLQQVLLATVNPECFVCFLYRPYFPRPRKYWRIFSEPTY